MSDRDWQAELDFLAWSADGVVPYGLTENGEWGYRCRDGSCIPSDDARLAEYRAYRERIEKAEARETSSKLGNLAQQGTDLVTSNSSDIESGDKTKLNQYKVLVQDARDTLDELVNYDWGTIE